MKKIIFAIIVISVIQSCKKESNNPKDNGVLFPLTIGDTWNYTRTLYDSFGVASAPISFSLTVIQSFVANGKTYFVIKGNDSIQYFTFRLASNILYYYFNSVESPFFILPVTSDTTLYVNGYNNTDSLITTEYSTPFTVNNFNCYKTRQSSIHTNYYYTSYQDYSIAEGIGIAEINIYVENSKEQYYKSEDDILQSYSLH